MSAEGRKQRARRRLQQRARRAGENHSLVTATPWTAVCECGARAFSWRPLGAITIINDHVAQEGGGGDY